ncbi:YncE family protein [Occallatibacter riparius]|uniref:Uncharacterized protein n=1 Tax=Occallatibacter riparius TaxID=1002689 RepID=A0A9J7BUV8_9BACT|nr:hypothetical protein [Occallatibacter riparius]UWZ85546.1 hypothetical protein MOP44_06290 [Occallatibacter riparius]
MFSETPRKFPCSRSRNGIVVAALAFGAVSMAMSQERSPLILTSTNDPANNAVVVFKLDTHGTPSLSASQIVPTGAKGGASGNAGILQFQGEFGAVANFGSNSVTQLVRRGDWVAPARTIQLASDCTGPDSVALNHDEMYVVGATCAESHSWPSGHLDGAVVPLTDNSAGQIVAGKTWAAVTMKSGTVLQLGLSGHERELNGSSNAIDLPADANDTPLGAAFWGDVLGFTPAHSPDSFAIVDPDRNVYPIAGPSPAFPTNAPCWVAKGPKSLWYTANSPGHAISIFFSDNKGGAFYKSVPVPGVPTDITVSPDQNWLAVIYTASGAAHVAVFSIDNYGNLDLAAISPAVGAAQFNGVAFSQ